MIRMGGKQENMICIHTFISKRQISVCRDDDKIAVKYLLRTNILNEKLLTN